MSRAASGRRFSDGLAARFALLLICALVAANLVALAVLSSERVRLGREARADREIERIVGLVPALEAVSPAQRRTIARDASTRVARVTVGPDPLLKKNEDDSRSRALAARLAGALGERAIRVAIRRPEHSRHAPDDSVDGAAPQTLTREREIIAISIGLHGSSDWLSVTTKGDRPPERGMEGFFLILGLSLVAVLAVGLLFVRRLTRPLTHLAEAARAAGKGDHMVRVPETGARELRDAAVAFNDMQSQIAQFEAERTRTLAAVGHDLRTPITSLRIRAEMLDDEARAPMVRTLDEMTVMAEGLVAFARGHGEAEKTQALDLARLLHQLCDERAADMAVGARVTVRGRPVALTRAFGNLIDNALRYGESARVSLTVEQDEAVIRVSDDGPGIPEERLGAVFEPFVRGEDSRNVDTGGAGLGLSIVRSILRAHGATITLANRPSGGLEATVRMPLLEPEG